MKKEHQQTRGRTCISYWLFLSVAVMHGSAMLCGHPSNFVDDALLSGDVDVDLDPDIENDICVLQQRSTLKKVMLHIAGCQSLRANYGLF